MKRVELWSPPLEELAPFVRDGMEANYAVVDVEVTDCPDLRTLGCASPGIGGSTVLLEVGGEPYAHNPSYRHVTFDMAEMASDCGQADGSIFGAGMAYPGVLDGHCGEVIATLQAGRVNRSKVARVGRQRECIVEPYASTRHSGLSNLFLSEGRRPCGHGKADAAPSRRAQSASHPDIGADGAPPGARQVGGRRLWSKPDRRMAHHYSRGGSRRSSMNTWGDLSASPSETQRGDSWRESGESLNQAGHYHYDVSIPSSRVCGLCGTAGPRDARAQFIHCRRAGQVLCSR